MDGVILSYADIDALSLLVDAGYGMTVWREAPHRAHVACAIAGNVPDCADSCRRRLFRKMFIDPDEDLLRCKKCYTRYVRHMRGNIDIDWERFICTPQEKWKLARKMVDRSWKHRVDVSIIYGILEVDDYRRRVRPDRFIPGIIEQFPEILPSLVAADERLLCNDMRDRVYIAGEGSRITRGEIGIIYEQHGEKIPDHLRTSFGYMAVASSVYMMNGPIDVRTLVGLLKTTMPPIELHEMIRGILATNVAIVAKKSSVGIIPRDLLPRDAKVYRRHNLIERIDFEEVIMKEPIEYIKYIKYIREKERK